jgi:hypothetical protein
MTGVGLLQMLPELCCHRLPPVLLLLLLLLSQG